MTHRQISFTKSAIRIVGYLLIAPLDWISPYFFAVSGVLVISEIIGIVEEIGDNGN